MKFPLRYQLLGLTVALGLVASLPGRAIAQFEYDNSQLLQNQIEDRFLWGPYLYGTPPGAPSDSIQDMTYEEYRAYQESRGSDTTSNDASGNVDYPSMFGNADILGRDANPNDSVPRQIASLYPVEDKASLEQMFSQLLTSFKADVQNQGLPATDVAFAMSRVICTSYEVIHQKVVPTSQYQAAEQQFNQVLANTPAFNQLSEAEKQDFYDRIVIQGLVLDHFNEQANSNNIPASRAIAVDIATRLIEDVLEVPASQVSVNDQGISF